MSNSFFPNRLFIYRKLHGLSMLDLAQFTGLNKGMISKFEKGTHTPSLSVILKIANYFCCSTDYLTGRTDDPRWMDYLPTAEEAFYHHPDTWQELIEMYQRDKAANPISLSPVFLRACEFIRDDHVREKNEIEKKTT